MIFASSIMKAALKQQKSETSSMPSMSVDSFSSDSQIQEDDSIISTEYNTESEESGMLKFV